ncbi:MAG: hypothetical protein N3D85_01935 [Candidatus Bathyarchaeota archaeon]|nr:hypothetical protein [Candidatus Bathyarchaeota archaeon]
MVTRGQRKLGRLIRKLENSVELSSKESQAKEAERQQRKKTGVDISDSPVQSLTGYTTSYQKTQRIKG